MQNYKKIHWFFYYTLVTTVPNTFEGAIRISQLSSILSLEQIFFFAMSKRWKASYSKLQYFLFENTFNFLTAYTLIHEFMS